jgi:hypothetical protein
MSHKRDENENEMKSKHLEGNKRRVASQELGDN